MRLSTAFLILLATSVVGFTGCNARRTQGVVEGRPHAKRLVRRVPQDRSATEIASSLATRGSDQCDCYTCRLKRQEESYVIQPVGQPGLEFVNSGDTLESVDPVVGQVIATPPPVADRVVAPVEDSVSEVAPRKVNPVEPAVVVEPERQQDIPGEVVEDELPTNVLPEESSTPAPVPAVEPDTDSDIDATPALDAPSARLKKMRTSHEVETLLVRSVPIERKVAAAEVSEPGFLVKPSAFRPTVKPRQPRQTVTPVVKQGRSIWFAPVNRLKPSQQVVPPEVVAVEPSAVEVPLVAEPQADQVLVAAESRAVVPVAKPIASAAAPVAKQETQERLPERPVVLYARPVDRHLTFNGRPTQAPVREARLIEHHSTRSLPQRQFVPQQEYFQQLPPMSQRLESPTPAAVRAPDAQSVQPATQRLPRAQASHNNRSFDRQPVPAPVASPRARVVAPNTPLLKLNAVVGGHSQQMLPPIATIQRQAEAATVHGTLQVPGASAAAQSQRHGRQHDVSGKHRLHTTPWRPMTVGSGGSRQVENSIRQLTIRPQSESAEIRGNTIDR